jgi:hypothetical protein
MYGELQSQLGRRSTRIEISLFVLSQVNCILNVPKRVFLGPEKLETLKVSNHHEQQNQFLKFQYRFMFIGAPQTGYMYWSKVCLTVCTSYPVSVKRLIIEKMVYTNHVPL